MMAKTKFFYDKRLEGLRGLCAIVVAINHVYTFNFFGASHTVLYQPFLRLLFAHIAVLIFFIISGYVMGISTAGSKFDFPNVINYLKKRLVRLYPIYLVALVITISLGLTYAPLKQVAGNLFFLQELIVPTLKANPVLWSLSYEVIYYLVFVFLWALSKTPVKLYLFLSIPFIILILPGQSANILKSLVIGWVFWLAGWFISRLSHGTNSAAKAPLLSYFFILLATFNLHSGGLIMQIIHVGDMHKQVTGIDLAYLPICLLIILKITDCNFRYMILVQIVAYLIPALSVFSLFYFKHDISENQDWIYGIGCYGIGLALFLLKSKIRYFEKLDSFGKISYAIYVFHFPIGFFLDLLFVHYLSGVPLLLTGIFCWITLTLIISYAAEIKLQPYIRKYFFRKQPEPELTLKP